MATVTDDQGRALSRQEQIDTLIAAGMPAEFARLVVAVEAGDLPGDVLELDENGNVVNTNAEGA